MVKTEDRSIFRAREGDMAVMLDSLAELFQERGDEVMPKDVAERMEQKLHRHIHHHVAAYLYTSLGFVTRRVSVHPNGCKVYIIPNPKLLAEKRAQFCNIDISPPGQSE
jgi:hypothetical protein